MSTGYSVEVQLFGALKDKFGSNSLQLNVLPNSTANEVKEQVIEMASRLHLSELVSRSALATEERILLGNEVVGAVKSLSLLPPVCGG